MFDGVMRTMLQPLQREAQRRLRWHVAARAAEQKEAGSLLRRSGRWRQLGDPLGNGGVESGKVGVVDSVRFGQFCSEMNLAPAGNGLNSPF
jgi:hypothetical protein